MRILFFSIFFMLAAYSAAFAQGTSTICRFTSGPQAGKQHDYAPMAALPIGTPCNDGAQSFGTVVAKSDGGGSGGGNGGGGTSTICRFTSGPQAGKQHDYAPMAALPIGTPCNDGAQSFGTVVAKSDGGGSGGGNGGGGGKRHKK